MSRSLSRVEAALRAAGLDPDILACGDETRTAAQAAARAGCALDQIAKSLVFFAARSGGLHLFLTAGGNLVEPDAASALAGEPLGRADPDLVRARTGFAIGGVAPVGHLTPLPVWIDPRLLDFDRVWAAAGTPRHIFAIPPDRLVELTGGTVAAFARPAPLPAADRPGH
ncbi:MAG: YbaK/EbsC family protein [Pseudomonadota bacterium]